MRGRQGTGTKIDASALAWRPRDVDRQVEPGAA